MIGPFRRTLRPPDLNPDGITATDWVRKIGAKGIGQVESVTNDHATVDWLDGKKEVLPCVMLQRIPPEQRPDLDRRGQ